MRRTKKKHEVKYPGIGATAKNLGVSREHLFRVLTGERPSRTLKAAWDEWHRHGTVHSAYKGRAERKAAMRELLQEANQ